MRISPVKFTTPILLISFNRPRHTQLVLNQIKIIQPTKLYYFNDGPRENNLEDIVKVREIRNLTTQINWDCQLETKFEDKNLGCGIGPSSAIDWAFEKESTLIILEDDCLPELSFFTYCEILLERFKYNNDIFAIGGRNELGKWGSHKFSYYYFYDGLWGWATWKRAWNYFDYNLKCFGDPQNIAKFHKFYNDDPRLYSPVEDGCKRFFREPSWGVWDYQWSFIRAINNGLVIVPSKNLVKNIGFDSDATHTKNKKHKSAKVKTYNLDFPLIHNNNISIDWRMAEAWRRSQDFNTFWKLYRFLKKVINGKSVSIGNNTDI